MSNERFNLIVAIRALCIDHYSGQWSRGYRLLSRIASRYPNARNLPDRRELVLDRYTGTNEWAEAYDLYRTLRATHRNKL